MILEKEKRYYVTTLKDWEHLVEKALSQGYTWYISDTPKRSWLRYFSSECKTTSLLISRGGNISYGHGDYGILYIREPSKFTLKFV